MDACAAAVMVLAALVQTQPISIQVDVLPTPTPLPQEPDEVEKRFTPELVQELESAKFDALTLYTDFTAFASTRLKEFIGNISQFSAEVRGGMEGGMMENAPLPCRSKFDQRLKKMEYDAHKAAGFSSENHHKFFLGHMIVFRMHLNKSEDYIKKCDKVIQDCGIACESTPKIKRWRRLAAEEIHRVRDDLEHSRRSYVDLLAHARRRLKTLTKLAHAKAESAVEELQVCTQGG